MELIDNPIYQSELKKVINHAVNLVNLDKKSILMIGASGMIGSFLIDTLMAANEQLGIQIKIYAMGRNRLKLEKRFEKYLQLDTFEIIEGDVTNSIPKEVQADYLIHGASNTHPRAYVTDPIGTIMTNLVGTEQVLKHAVATRPVRVLFLSTVEIYGENRGDVEKFTEDYCGYIDCNTLRAGYPEGKRVSESLCQAYIEKYDLDIVIPRLCRTFGPTMLLSDTKASSQFILNAVEQKDIILKSEGNQYFSYIYVGDAVSAILHLLLEGKKGEAYNVSSENFDLQLKELAQQLAEISDKKVIFDLPDGIEQKGFSTASTAILDNKKIKENGWYPIFELRESLKNTVELVKGEK
ncbi:NAD-dependent epimerase/dehydratase family protein [Enterococcus faecalis]|uniref:NAD-dependent epimerase/dehydratase family protein n=1 Tax=Enterococcus faecalis TaxID=1351 RepID=A0A4U3KHG1_ENTFL|nr:NAD-dependent epimerase/dehydratase family protein [Enterococcus faecalis]EGO5038473.1 NAD-dependent epimerase/dehydratase family protein [Enterococcus faecalis]EGO6092754.1 NAD-dependent epimerase/dehydratase family protein [Enterococcus faecalis]EGO9043471.1 dTDP-glucose 4,6-dehydratase [Enterococcus faecalis]EHF1219164.1 NAD-dependent epimerase/dehydratase family protein [Enterococcus faecalis]EHP0865859.1 NAD-dependent epimerase/dehydratase family protein [Enterococcus faecalis]